MKFHCKKKSGTWHPEMWHAAPRKKTLFKKYCYYSPFSYLCLLQTQHIIAQNFLRVLQFSPPIIFAPMLHTQHFIQLLMLHNLSNWQHHYVKPLPCLSYQIPSDILLLLIWQTKSHTNTEQEHKLHFCTLQSLCFQIADMKTNDYEL